MTDVNKLITDNIDVWTSAIKKRNSQGRGSNSKVELVGVKKLRELILELAVRGQLVPQDPNDEPASVLIEKIEAEKTRLIANKEIKSQKPFIVIPEQEKVIDLPQSWYHVRLGDIGFWAIGSGFPKAIQGEINKPVLVSKVSDMNLVGNEKYIVSSNNSVDFDTAKQSRLKIHKEGTVIFPKIGGAIATNKRRIIVKPTVIDNNCLGITPYASFESEYLYLYLNSIDLTKYQAGTSVPALSQSVLELIILGLPPIKEQHRIVAKVDELMALCDQLEQQTEQSLTAHQTLVEVLLSTLTESDNAEDFQTSWQRIAEHFDVLFTTEESIEQLKQTILQLAVMGKLVPQNPDDEPASVLLEKIAEEKAKLIADKKIKKQKPLPAITDEEKPFELPNAWEWCHLEDTALNSEAGWSPRCLPTPRDNTNWAVLKVSAVTWGIFNPNENKELPSGLEPRPQYEVQSGDFLISRANTAELVARAVIVPLDAPKKLMMSDKIIRFVLSPRVEGSFISLVNNSKLSRAYYAEVAGGTSSSMKNVSREQIRSLVVALPPLVEQHHIVAKVDELMALCDQLKNRLADAQITQHHLADAVVENALN